MTDRKYAIDWNRRAIRRATLRLRLATTPEAQQDARRDIERFEKNIRDLGGQAR